MIKELYPSCVPTKNDGKCRALSQKTKQNVFFIITNIIAQILITINITFVSASEYFTFHTPVGQGSKNLLPQATIHF